MNTLTIRGSSLRDALSRVRAHLGEDAVVLETRALPEEHTGQGAPYEILASTSISAREHLQLSHVETLDDVTMLLHTLRSEIQEIRTALPTSTQDEATLTGMMQRHFEELKGTVERLRASPAESGERTSGGDPFVHELIIGGVEPVLARILSERARTRAAPRSGLGIARVPDLRGEFVRSLSVTDPLWSRDGRVALALVGPTGVGKTRTIAKLATLTTFVHNRSVGVISTDVKRIGGTETLETLAELAGVPFEAVGDVQDLRAALRAMSAYDLVLVDTPGVSPWDDDGLGDLERLFAATSLERHLVLTADTPTDRARLMAKRFGGSHLKSLVLTKLDESSGPGSVLSSVWGSGLPISHVCDGQSIPDTCHAMDPERWSERVVGSRT
jgi:flagellar biosynthesis GTPase FlhF